jgi:hypothetical protein
MSGQTGIKAMRGRHWVWHLVLAVAVLLAQSALVRHQLQHGHQGDADAAHAVCMECLALHAADPLGTAPDLPTLAPPAPAMAAWAPWFAAHAHNAAPRPYQSRAPPPLSA